MKSSIKLLVAAAVVAAPLAAIAHVGVTSPAFANTTQEITFSVGHGCEGLDTSSVKVDIPAGVTSVRGLTSDFGRVTIERNNAGDAVSATWVKPDEDLIEADDNYYKLTLRFRVPNTPFTTIYFPTHQVCSDGKGTTKTAEWVAKPGETGEPAPAMKILPARTSGWNKYTVPAAIADLNVYFADAQIVWKDSAAFSSNANTKEQIKGTSGVTELTSLAAGDVVWVKY